MRNLQTSQLNGVNKHHHSHCRARRCRVDLVVEIEGRVGRVGRLMHEVLPQRITASDLACQFVSQQVDVMRATFAFDRDARTHFKIEVLLRKRKSGF